jgi:hypothetical protein
MGSGLHQVLELTAVVKEGIRVEWAFVWLERDS